MSFIFQASMDQYNLPEELVPGKTVRWVASRHRSMMKLGDVIYFWLAGPVNVRGLYGWGIIVGEVPQKDSKGNYRIDVEYRCRFKKEGSDTYIPSTVMGEDETLRTNQLFQMPIGTNFILTNEQDAAIRKIIIKKLGPENLPDVRENNAIT